MKREERKKVERNQNNGVDRLFPPTRAKEFFFEEEEPFDEEGGKKEDEEDSALPRRRVFLLNPNTSITVSRGFPMLLFLRLSSLFFSLSSFFFSLSFFFFSSRSCGWVGNVVGSIKALSVG